jgi:hypothetical protein
MVRTMMMIYDAVSVTLDDDDYHDFDDGNHDDVDAD